MNMVETKSLDLVQLRWQQIRNFENQRKLEVDNLKLREDLIKHRDNEANSKYKHDGLQAVLLSLASKLHSTQQDLVDLKSTIRIETSCSERLLAKTLAGYNQLKTKYSSDHDDLSYCKEELETLRHNLAEARMSINTSTKQRSDENDTLKSKLSKLQRELADCEREKESYRKEALTQKYKAEKDADVRSALETKVETLAVENKSLKASLRVMEAEKQSLMQQHVSNHHAMIQQYEQTVAQYSSDNDDLRSKVAELQDQLERVMTELIGKKSHFARFVEVKTENMNLQSKLSNMTKVISKSTGLSCSSFADNNEGSPLNAMVSPSTRSNRTLRRRGNPPGGSIAEDGPLSSRSGKLLAHLQGQAQGYHDYDDMMSIDSTISGKVASSKFRALSPLMSPPQVFRFDGGDKSARGEASRLIKGSERIQPIAFSSPVSDKNRVVV